MKLKIRKEISKKISTKEKQMEFLKVDVVKYVKNLLAKQAEVKQYRKVAKVNAVRGQLGQKVITKMKNGLDETENFVKINSETGEVDWIVTNPSGEQYIVSHSTFKEKYELVADENGFHKAKGGIVKAVQIDESIAFLAPWGAEMKIAKGGFLVVSNFDDIYGIQLDEFNETYEEVENANCNEKEQERI